MRKYAKRAKPTAKKTYRRKSIKQTSLKRSMYYGNTSLRSQQVFPRTMYTTLTTTFACVVPASATNSGFMQVNTNSMYQPFYTSYNPVTSSFGTGVACSGYTITDQPLWYSEITAIYNYYKVTASKLDILCQPGNATDYVQIIAYPTTVANFPLGTPQTSDSLTQPYAKSITCIAGQSARENSISLYGKTQYTLGMSSIQYKGLSPTSVSTNPSGNAGTFANVTWTDLKSGVNTGALYFTFKLTQYIILTNQYNDTQT